MIRWKKKPSEQYPGAWEIEALHVGENEIRNGKKVRRIFGHEAQRIVIAPAGPAVEGCRSAEDLAGRVERALNALESVDEANSRPPA